MFYIKKTCLLNNQYNNMQFVTKTYKIYLLNCIVLYSDLVIAKTQLKCNG